MNNPLAANKEIYSILQTDPSELYFSERNISNQDFAKHSLHFLNSLVAYLNFIKEKLGDRLLADMLITYVADFYSGEDQKKLIDLRFNNFDKNFILENITSPVWGKEFLGFWSRQAINQLTTIEFHQTLEKNLSDSRLNQQFNSLVWIFQDYFPPQDEWRRIILNKAIAYQKSKNYHERYLFLLLLKNESIKNQLLKRDGSLSTPIYQLQRKFYRELLENKVACDFAIATLFKLGDEDETYRQQFKICP